MLPIVSIIVIILLTVFVFLFIRRFTIVKVNGDSMFPTFKDGQFRVVDSHFNWQYIPKFDSLEGLENRIFVYMSPTGLPVIKRLIYVSYTRGESYYWFEGDNPDHSEDSRHYGFIRSGQIYGEVVGVKEILKRLFIFQQRRKE